MGTAVSRSLDLSTNEYCLKFVGKEAISLNHPFWNRFLSFNITPPTTRNDQILLESKIESLCQELLKNSVESGNVSTLIRLFVTRSSELLGATDSNAIFNWQLFNTLFTIRCVLKFFIETTTEEQLLELIEHDSNESNLESFIEALFAVVVDVPVQDTTYGIHLEAITCLLILLSVQFHSGQRSDNSVVYHTVMNGRHVISSPLFVKCLMINFINQQALPPGYGAGHGQSLVIGLASELWSILTFSKKSEDAEVSEQSDFQRAPLATQSILLLLVLVHNWATVNNPYRLSLFSCSNQDNNPLPPTNENSIFKLDFQSLYLTICKKANGDAPTLLLYLLLHRNASFKTFLLSRLDIQGLIIPILKTLYNAPNSHSHHIYMSIIILLILSEDDVFNKTIHQTKLKNITWYTERQLTEISLGGLLILVIIRTIKYNMLKMRDKYLHTNCLAALANMSSQFRDLHPYISQRLVSLFETMAKKYQKLHRKLQNGKEIKLDETTIQINDSTELEQDVNVLEEVLRMVLEIINSCLTSQLTNNPNLIYTLLYNRQVFEAFRDNVVFQDIIYNIDIVIKYFSDLLNTKSNHQEVDASQVLQVIQQGGRQWPRDKLAKFPDLKFKYVEEEQPEEFFIPYVWELVNQQSVLNWHNSSTVSVAVC
ncbi:dymeclin isoform X2 [Dendroctonus ponderosae]|uniref:dymeclin isoform X2 n=1 Tax=Dendroctonus ponderosae TaxID=77166 RepID=UPI002035799A|nr:dymeclin isoform X2 [Dendroctonus ponderosae]